MDALTSTTGDLNNNFEKVVAELKTTCVKVDELDHNALKRGDPACLLPILHQVLFSNSLLVAKMLSHNYTSMHTSDHSFLRAAYRILRNEFCYRPTLTEDQFLTKGFAERKLILLFDVIRLCKRKAEELEKSKKQSKWRPKDYEEGKSYEGRSVSSSPECRQLPRQQPVKVYDIKKTPKGKLSRQRESTTQSSSAQQPLPFGRTSTFAPGRLSKHNSSSKQTQYNAKLNAMGTDGNVNASLNNVMNVGLECWVDSPPAVKSQGKFSGTKVRTVDKLSINVKGERQLRRTKSDVSSDVEREAPSVSETTSPSDFYPDMDMYDYRSATIARKLKLTTSTDKQKHAPRSHVSSEVGDTSSQSVVSSSYRVDQSSHGAYSGNGVGSEKVVEQAAELDSLRGQLVSVVRALDQLSELPQQFKQFEATVSSKVESLDGMVTKLGDKVNMLSGKITNMETKLQALDVACKKLPVDPKPKRTMSRSATDTVTAHETVQTESARMKSNGRRIRAPRREVEVDDVDTFTDDFIVGMEKRLEQTSEYIQSLR